MDTGLPETGFAHFESVQTESVMVSWKVPDPMNPGRSSMISRAPACALLQITLAELTAVPMNPVW